MHNVLVTGAAGFIGSHISQYLLNCGRRVIGFDNLNNYYDVALKKERLRKLGSNSRWHFIHGDIANSQSLAKVFFDYSISSVLHLAAQAGVRWSIENPEAYITSNLVGFANIAEACRRSRGVAWHYKRSPALTGTRYACPEGELRGCLPW